MSRPCKCDRCLIGQPYDTDQCRLCWLWHNDVRYRSLWSGIGLGDAVAAVAQPVARGLDWLLGTNLQGCAGCEGRRQKLNEWGENLRRWMAGESPNEPVPLILDNRQSTGAIVVMTGVVRELHREYPGRFVTDVRSTVLELWQNNPYLTPLSDGIHLPITYAGIHPSSQSGKHFMQAMADDLATALGLSGLEVKELRGSIYLTDEEKAKSFEPKEPYWLVCSDVESDYTCKAWPYYQEVVDALKGELQFVQVGALGSGASRHIHQPPEGVFNHLGQTNHRDLIQLVYHSQGVLSGVTYLMHLAAAFRKPCVTLLCGREPLTWIKYPYDRHVVLHTIGQLDCCQTGGCWRSRVVPLNDGDEKDHSLCLRPKDGYPECMRMIEPQRVIEAIRACRF